VEHGTLQSDSCIIIIIKIYGLSDTLKQTMCKNNERSSAVLMYEKALMFKK